MIFFMTSFTLSLVLILLNSLISKKKKNEREKPSPFECGFDPKVSSRIPFSLQFYLIAVIFLIFDVEITLIMPIPILMKMFNLTFWMSIMVIFLIILLVGLYHEWNQGALQWKF
uniref:NADH dehydrogenase subunit 3 n=1 Tax=Tomocerus caputiviolaceus TaxID=2763923 RepID=UPI0021D52F1B|nr:NADH dehydrogenase subunit 3 [Tomocerus caputiviolaceus]UXC95410.1 NADH dehydrogenase subunit 3 [Tomocerus caputiviolaceus]